jgi:hypothetical protein
VEILPGGFDDPIDVNLRMASLQYYPQYDALSYVWKPLYGTSGNPIDPITVINLADVKYP